MTVDEIERAVQRTVEKWAFVLDVETADKTDNTVKMRLMIDGTCFVQVYVNTRKRLTDYALILGHTRIYGRDCEGGVWHRHPQEAPDTNDFSPEGQRAISLDEFLKEAQQVLQNIGIL